MEKTKILRIIFALLQILIVIFAFIPVNSTFSFIIKALIIIYELCYILSKTTKKDRYKYLTYFILLFVFAIIYGLTVKNKDCVTDYLYFPITFLFGDYLFRNIFFDRKKALKFLTFVTFPLLIVSFFFRNLLSIDCNLLIGELLILLYPVIISRLGKRVTIFNFILLFITTLTILVLENRTLIVMLISILLVYFIYYVIKIKEDKNRPLVMLLLLIICLLFTKSNAQNILLSSTFSSSIFIYRTSNMLINIICLILYLVPIFVLMQKEVNLSQKSKNRPYEILILFAISIADFLVITAFHTLSATIVLTILLCIIKAIVEEKITLNNRKLNNKKLAMLALHLGNGGIEKATVNTANALSKDFDVELVVAYKLSDKVLYDIDKNVEIKYLIDNDIAQRTLKYKKMLREFDLKRLFSSINCDYFKNKKIKKLFIDIYDSIKVTFLKSSLMIDYLEESKCRIIISTRVEFSSLLSRYGSYNSKKIAVEHRHHRNEKNYIKTIRNCYDNINYLVVLTEGLKKDYSSFLKKNSKTKVVCIPNMLVENKHLLSNLDGNKVISIGRLVKIKGLDQMVEIAERCQELEFNVIGDGDQRDVILSLVNNKKLNNFHLLGQMKNEDAMKVLEKSSIFVMTSLSEGLPMVLLEAFSYGIPVVAYKTDSGVEDIVDDGINGYVIEERNPDKFAKKLEELMKNDKKRKKFGQAAYKKSLKFSSEEITKKWLEIL